jgi:lipooligosaccharide transport system ATP-binding protein
LDRPVPGPTIVAKGLRKSFGELSAVDGLDLEVPAGICFGLLGPNGAGKTTTIRMIQGQMRPTAGSLTVLGHDVASDVRALKQRLGVVPQENNLDPDFTVHKNLTTYARFFRVPPAEAARRADELLGFVQLGDKRDAAIAELSGGMKRRLVVARSLVNKPELLVLDEPTTGLDPQARHSLWDLVRRMKAQGTTVLLTTHYMDEAEMLCDVVAVMDKGRVLEQGPPRQLIAKHTEGEAVEFVFTYGETAPLEALARELSARGIAAERLPDRIVAYGSGAGGLADTHGKSPGVREVIRRRATLEDVFLRLTGRGLRD